MRNLILAGDYNQYKCSPYYPESRYVSSIEDIYGYGETVLIKIGTWYKKWDIGKISEVEFYCKTHNIKIEN